MWAPTANITAAKAQLEADRAMPQYAKKLERARSRREAEQVQYVDDFECAVRTFLRFAPSFASLEEQVAQRVTAHATPVGSGTVARTERIPLERRAEAAVIAWMRHKTTAYDSMKVACVKGARREVRRQLAQISRAVLDLHRGRVAHSPGAWRTRRARGALAGRVPALRRGVLRGPLSLERLSWLPDGRVAYRVKRPAPSGQTQLVLEPLEFLRRLAALVPPPRVNLVRLWMVSRSSSTGRGDQTSSNGPTTRPQGSSASPTRSTPGPPSPRASD